MLEHVARDQKAWLDKGYKCVPVSVNVSRAHFIESDLAEQIRDTVDKFGTPHQYVEIELTESAFFDDKKALISTITRLKEYGFAVSMDDFGSGYSSLNSLKDMPLDVLKLDAEFFRGDNQGERGEIVVSEAIKLAKSLNMRTVAEGVEVREQVDFLAKQGCDMIQGYIYAKPMPGDEYEQRMQN
jgi:EAL domain-containing protein (putative c-di-GMP-specific phosphodiesterase class I)